MKEFDVGVVPSEIGELPPTMLAVTIRKEREGAPINAMKVERVPIPEIGPNEVLVLVMAVGLNPNGVWASLGYPISCFSVHSDPFHITGSDASGIVWRVGSQVRNWKPGDPCIMHCSQSCWQCPACTGQDPMACEQHHIWGYQSNWGSLAQFTKVQAQQLLRKPEHLSWEESASYGTSLFTAYRMLISQVQMRAGQYVLIWGAAGGLGVFAIQLCKLMGVNPIAVISSPEKISMVQELGATLIINRANYDFGKGISEYRAFGREIRRLTGGFDPDIVFEHSGKETFGVSCYVVKKFGKVVFCGATSGYMLTVDARYLWMRQKSIIGSHMANPYEAYCANQLVIDRKIKPIIGHLFSFAETPEAHQLMADNKHRGKLVVRVQVPRS